MLLGPGLVFYAVLVAAPVLLVLAYMFASRGRFGGVEWTLGFDNFERALDPLYLNVLLDSVVIATHLLGEPPAGERWSTSRLLARFQVDTTGLRRHDALHDVKILGRILGPMLRQIREDRADRLEIPAGKPLQIRRHPPVRSGS